MMSTKIVLPSVPDDAFKKDRPVSGLLKAQILHLHEAERRLPLRHHTDIYINAIKTEGEAAEYIRGVTEAIHDGEAAARRTRPRRKDVIEIAAVADETAMREPPAQKPKGKKKAKS